jgi:hypothetical protein
MVGEGVGVLERNGATVLQGFPVIHEAVVVGKPLEDLGVDEMGGAEPTTGQMNAGDVATSDAHIHYLHRVGGNATRECRRGALGHHYVFFAAFFSPHSVRFYHCCTCKAGTQK